MENNMKESSGSSTSTSLSTNSSPPRYSENLPMPRHARLPLEHDESDKEEEEEEEALAAGGVVSGAFCHCRKRNLLNATKMEKQRQNEEIANEAELSLSLTAKGACFIDASSLLDEDELLNVNRQTTTTTATAIAITTTTTTTAINQSNSSSSCNSEPDGAGAAMLPKDATNNTATATTTTTTTNSSNINNLSDEEKLWKRHQHKQTADDDTEASISLAAYASDISERSENILIKYQQPAQQQHQQQSAAAHKTITYTTLPLSMSPKFNAFHTTTTTTTIGENELCYTTDYSSSSPAASLVWSKQDKRTLQQQPPITTAANTLINNYKHEFNLMPDTPHNSIVNIEHNTNNNSNTSSIHRDCSTLSSSLSQQRDSGAFCMDSPISLPSTPKPAYRQQQQQQQQQQHQHQKQQMLAEKSASQMEDDAEVAAVELRRYVKPAAQPVALSASWVVDMSDCRSSNSSFSDLSLPATKQRDRERDRERERCDSGSSIRSNRSCGFYVPLSIKADQVESLETTTPQPQSQQNTTKNLHLNTKSYTGPAKTKAKSFFINLSQSDTQVIDKQAESVEKQQQHQQQQQTESNERYDKKSIFSLFIDIGGEKKREFPAQLAQRLIGSKRYMTTAGGGNVAGNNATEQQHQQHQQQPQYEQQQQQQQNKSSNSSTETLMSKSANFKKQQQQQQQQQHSNNNNNNETIINRRRHVNDNNSSKRHSWNEHNDRQTTDEGNNQYKRSISLTNTSGDKDGLMSIIDKIAIISKTTQQQQQQQHGGVIDNSSCTESATNSHTNLSLSSSVEQQQQQQQQRQKIRQRDVAINQTYDVCSLASITDSLLSKDPSPISTADTDDLTFQQDEELATLDQQTDTIYDAGNNRMATILETKETPTKQQKQQQHQSCNLLDELAMEPAETDNLTRHTMETLHATIEKQKMLLETVNEHAEVICGRSAFVKLSDLDKPVDEVFLKCTTNEQQQQQRAFNRSNIGRPHSWTHSMTRSSGCSAAHSLLNITSSMENLRSLTRLFPHFSKEISNSLPNDVTLHHLEYAPTDASGDSSMASSFSRSGMDESSISCRQPRRLGEDLLKMFLQEIATDMIVEVHGRRIRAHKCILRSRCQYFAAVLAGNEHQSIVSLQGYSHSAVHFALCHIYSGASHPPDGVSLMELAALADLMGLEGLKEVTAHALKINYCHNFHKPCAGCIDGILQVLPVALNHALDDLYRKCLRWTCRYYLKVWATRQFCQLPTDILARCRQQIIAYLSSETVLDTLLECETLLLHMANCSWGGVCESLARDIIDACHSFIAGHFASLVASDAFLSLGNDHSEHIPQLEDVLLRIASTLNAEQACRSYQRVTRLNTVLEGNALHLHANLGALAKELQGLQDEDLDWNPEFIRLVSAIMSAVEQCLVRQCSRAMRVTAWQRMDLNLRKKIQTLAHLTDPIELKRGRALPKSSFTVGGGSRNQDLYQVKLAIQAHSRRSNPHDIYNMPTIGNHTHTQTIVPPKTIERGVQATTMEPKNAAKGKILKSNSRSYVPQPVRNNAYKNQKNNNLNINNNNHFNNNNNNNLNNNHINETNHTYRRTQSTENPSKKLVQQRVAALESSSESLAKPLKKLATQTVKLSEVRPRYLEPRKLHTQRSEGPVRSATSSSIPSGSAKIKVPQMSSSQSSRHSSPAASKKSQTKPTRNGTSVGVVGGTHSARRSYDSLTTPPMRGKSNNSSITSKLSDNDHYSEAGSVNTTADSQATNTTVSSHKSFKEMGKFSRSNPLMGKKDMLEKRRQPLHLSQQQKQQQQRLSAGSSPSSIATSKSATSRLSSVSSSQSTRDIYKQRSISMTTGQQQQQQQQQQIQQQQQRYSFLSAKSREILARRAEKNKLQAEQMKRMKELQQQQQQQKYVDDNVFIDDDDDDVNEVELRVPALRVHNNRLTTTKTTINSVPATRPNSLNLRKNNNSFSNNRQATTTTTTTTNNYNKHKLNKIDVDVDVEVEVPPSPSPSPPTTMNNSNTMERSNTFCKDSPALDINHMQIID